MYHLRLKKALSYSGIVSATREHPDIYIEDSAIAVAAEATGYFEFISDAVPSIPASPEPQGKLLTEMTTAELQTFASYKNISTKGLNKKIDIITKLRAELPDEETRGNITYGSPTMAELQEN